MIAAFKQTIGLDGRTFIEMKRTSRGYYFRRQLPRKTLCACGTFGCHRRSLFRNRVECSCGGCPDLHRVPPQLETN